MEGNIFDHVNATAVNTTTTTSSTDEEINAISSLSALQEAIIAFVPIIPSLLSMAGSLIIMRLVHRKKYKSPFRRLLFGMSAYDLVASTFVTLQSFLVDKETSRRYYAIGNTSTCNLLGWGFQFTCGTFLYFGALSTYYLMVVRFGMKDPYIAKRIEPFMHAFVLLWSTITSFVGLGKGMYGEQEIGAGCYLSPTDSCDAACIANVALLFTGGPYILTLLLVLGNNLTIYCHVRRTVLKYVRKSRARASQNLGFASSDRGSVLRGNAESERAAMADSVRVQKKVSEVGSQQKRVQLVKTQSLLYCLAFIVSYMWTLILRAAISYTEGEPGPEMEGDLFIYMLLRAIFAPAMGFWSFLIYARPRFLQIREKTLESRFQTLIRIIQDDDIRGLRNTNTNNASNYNNSRVSLQQNSRISGNNDSTRVSETLPQ